MPGKEKRQKAAHIPVIENSVLYMPLGKLGGYEKGDFCINPSYQVGDEFVLALSLAFNDLKNILTWLEINRELFEGASGVTKEMGQAAGIDNHLFRLMCGWLVEVTKLISNNQNFMKTEFWVKTIGKLTKGQRVHWESLCELGPENLKSLSGDPEKLRLYLREVRNHGGFHYWPTDTLREGFCEHFSTNTAESELMFSITGKNAEESRLFYSDAAVTATVNALANGEFVKFQEMLGKYLRDANRSILAVVNKYMAKRQFTYRRLEI